MSTLAARRYATALLELAQERHEAEALGHELDRLVEVIGGFPELAATLRNPAVRKDERHGVVEALSQALQLGPTLSTFLLLLVDKGRADQLLSIAQDYTEGLNALSERVVASVRSARSLTEEELQALRKCIENSTGKKVSLEASTDPSLLGGVVTQVGSVVFDGSVQGRLNALRDRLIQETV